MAGIGRFGSYVRHGKTYANIETGDDVLTVGLNRAVTLIEERKAKGPRKGRFGADPGRPLGEHPDKGGQVVVKNGRYGPYVSHDGVNATLPSDMTPDTVTLEQALPLLDARAARGTGKKTKRGAAKKKKDATAAEPAAAEAPKAKTKKAKAKKAKATAATEAPAAEKTPSAAKTKAPATKPPVTKAPAKVPAAAKTTATKAPAINGAKAAAVKSAVAAKSAPKPSKQPSAPVPVSDPAAKARAKSAKE
jgi:DNA topoisomerase-1